MAGDGINDTPALAQANIGIAMGTGTDVAIESDKITLFKGDLQGIVKAKNLSHAAMRNIKQNLFFAFFLQCARCANSSRSFISVFWNIIITNDCSSGYEF